MTAVYFINWGDNLVLRCFVSMEHIGVYNLGLNPYRYIDFSFNFMAWKDIWTGLIKGFVFAMTISMVGCYMGLNTRGGAEGVGKATTVSVVTSFILIILFDCILTGVFYFSNM